MNNERLATKIVETKNQSSLKIKFDCGFNNEGRSIIKSRTYSNLKPTAQALDVYNVANALASLQKNRVLDILKQDSTSLNP